MRLHTSVGPAGRSAMEINGIALGVIIVTTIRLVVPFAIFRWPFWGGVATQIFDAVDVILVYLIGQGDYKSYHQTDKYLDSYVLAFMALYSWRRWRGLEQRIALGLFGWRMIGFLTFEMTDVRWILLIFPNLFLWWWLFIAWRDRYKPRMQITGRKAGIVLGVMFGPKMIQEMILHYWQLHPVSILQEFFQNLLGI